MHNIHTPHGPSIVRARFDHAQDKAADAITRAAGSLMFVYVHTIWFAIWIIANTTGANFDPFPFGLLTLIVSLEAIFLSTFVMVSQNRQGARSEIKAQLDFETNVRSEVWALHIGHALNIDADLVEAEVQAALKAVEES